MCWFWQSPWQKDKKEDKEEKKAQPNIYTIHAKHVITIPKDVQLTCNTHGETHDELLGLSGDNDLQQMKPLLPLLQAMPPLAGDEIKGQSIEKKPTVHLEWEDDGELGMQ